MDLWLRFFGACIKGNQIEKLFAGRFDELFVIFPFRTNKQRPFNLQCHTPFTEEDVVILNGNEEEMDLMLSKMEARTARQKAAKKDKKAKKQIEATIVSEQSEQQPVATTSDKSADVLPPKSVSSKVQHSVKPFLKREAQNDALIDPAIKKLKDGVFSVAEDKSKSEVYKSLFTTHKSEQDQSRAHWVTYNPFYN